MSTMIMKQKLTISILLLFLGVGSPVVIRAQTLDPSQKRINEYIDKNNTEAVSLLERVVNIESPTEDLAGVKNVGTAFGKEFEALGMSVKWIDLPPDMKRAGHLFAQTSGTRGKRILLLGHLDTVLRGEKFRRDGNRAYGTGINDMKGGDVIILYALKALNSIGALKDTQVIVMLTGDEENSGKPLSVSRGDMIEAAKRSDAALSFEAAVRNTATVGRRGASSWRLEVEAKTGHSSGIFKESAGNGAIFEASRILDQFYQTLRGEKYLTFNPSIIVGGTTAELASAQGSATGKSNVIPAKVIVSGDLRFISEEQKEAARQKMRDIVAKSLPGASAKITFEDGLPAMTPNEGNYALLNQLDKVSQDIGFGKVEALDPGDRGAGDIGAISGIVPGLDGLGIDSGGNSHAPGEWTNIDSLPTLTKRAAILIYRLTR
jgi:glutamate carboxypeptidase